MATEARLLGGRYELGEVLGYGGMAEVHLGRDVGLGRDVALKLLRGDLAPAPSFQGRFRREAQSAASLNHPSIVAVYDSGDDAEAGGASTPYIVMEYVQGRTLREVLELEEHLLSASALELTAQICAALDQAHRAGIGHRDVKPGNVMLTPAGEVKVMDFGIARAVTGTAATMTQTAAVIGTAHYLSPEQARGEHVDARSDVYSTGCLLYELLTGGPPFSGDSAVAVAYQHVREEPVPPSRVEPDVTPAIDAIVLKAMAKNPANRYQTAGEMRADIERALAGRPVEATPLLAADQSMLMPPPTTVLMRQPPEARRGRGAAYTLLALATIGVFLITLLAATHFFSGSGGGGVNTPNVVGQSLADAEATLAGKGLAVGKIVQQYDTKVPRGDVISQDPPPDILLRKGQSVDLVVSLGVHIVIVPGDLVGLTQDEARARLGVALLRVGQVVSRNSDAPAGQVLGTDPTGGSRVAENTAVTLFVSNARVKVPNVIGKDAATATSLLEQAGFVVIEQPAAVFDRKKPEGTVLGQSPSGGTFQKTGSQVQIFVNTKPSPSPTPSPSASTLPTPLPSTLPSTSPTPTP